MYVNAWGDDCGMGEGKIEKQNGAKEAAEEETKTTFIRRRMTLIRKSENVHGNTHTHTHISEYSSS